MPAEDNQGSSTPPALAEFNSTIPRAGTPEDKQENSGSGQLKRINTDMRLTMTMRRAMADAPPPSEERMKTLRTFAMARVAESLRFDLTDEEMEEPLTKELLSLVCHRANDDRLHEPKEKVDCAVDRLWDVLESIGMYITTLGDLLDIECPNFPETTKEERDYLKKVAGECDIVTKHQIEQHFQDKADDDNFQELMEFLYNSGVEALPGEVFQDIVGTLETHPYSQPFCHSFTNQMVSSGRKMMTLFPFLILVIAAMVVIPQIANIAHHEMMKSVITVIDDDWDNGCPDGPTSILGCNFIQRNLNVVETIEFDALRFFRDQLIQKLWPEDGQSAALNPVGFDQFTGSTFPIGALVLRLVAEESAKVAPAYTCADLNLTASTLESRVFMSYGCDAMWSAIIPFNSTKAEALSKASSATATFPVPVGGALIAQFGTFEPATMVAAYFKVTLSLPKAGHVVTRIEAIPVDYSTHESVLPLLIINVIVFSISLGFAIFYSFRGQPFINADLVIDLIIMVLISVAYGLLNNLPTFDVYQITYATKDHDVAAYQFEVAVRLLAFWVMGMMGVMARYLQEIGALYIVIAIIQYAALEIAALIVIFGVWTLSFALMANLFFGSIAVEHASTFSSFAFLFEFFASGGNYERLAFHHQILGPVYWFFFSVFVTFLALNLLIAVLTAPLAEVKETCDLHIIMHDKVRIEIQMDGSLTPWERTKENLRSSVLPFITLMYDAAPSPPIKLYSLNINVALTTLCTVYAHGNPRLAADAAADFLTRLNQPTARIPFETRLANNVVKSADLDEYSLAFTLQYIAGMSQNSVVRDARLEKALMLYDIHTTNTNKLQEKQDESREIAKELSTNAETPFSSFEIDAVKKDMNHFSTNSPKVSQEVANPLEAGSSEVGASSSEPQVTGESMEVKQQQEEEEEDQPCEFAFTQYLLRRQRKSRLFAVQFVVLSIVFGWFFATGLTRDNTGAYLVGSISEGIVKFPLFQGCDDDKCEGGHTWRKEFGDTDNLPEWYDFMEKVFVRQLFLANELNLSTTPNTLYWDRRATFDLPIKIRQVRAAEIDCQLPEVRSKDPGAIQRRQYLKDNYKCTRREKFREADMPIRPFPAGSSLNDTSIFTYQKTCPELRKIAYWGFFEMQYPCEGYIATVHSKQQLEDLLAFNWIDNKTRMISVTTIYRSADAVIEHTLYTGLGAGGAAANTNALATSLSENRGELDTMLIVCMVCLSMDAIIEILSLIYQHLTSKEKVHLNIAEIFPTQMIVVYILVLVIPYMFYPQPAVNERVKLQLGIASLCLTYMATNVVFFPIAGLFSKQATLLFDTLGRSAKQIALVAPFYVIFIIALAYSGLLLFSARTNDFSSLRFAIQTVARGALGDLDKSALTEPLPEMAEVYNIIFYAVILIMLANLVLAMVTSAASDALGAPLAVELGERVCDAFGWHVAYGSLVEFLIAWNIFFLRKSSGSAADSYREMSTIATGDGKRLPYLSETLCCQLGPNRANDVLTQLRLDSVATNLYPSTMIWILEQHAHFQDAYRIEEALDDEREKEMLSTYHTPAVSFEVHGKKFLEGSVSETKPEEKKRAVDQIGEEVVEETIE